MVQGYHVLVNTGSNVDSISDWLDRMVQPIGSYVTLRFTNYLRKRRRIYLRVICEYGLGSKYRYYRDSMDTVSKWYKSSNTW